MLDSRDQSRPEQSASNTEQFDNSLKMPDPGRCGITSNLSDESFDIFVRLMPDRRSIIEGLGKIKDLVPNATIKHLEAFTLQYSSSTRYFKTLDWKTTPDLIYDINVTCAKYIQSIIGFAVNLLSTDSKDKVHKFHKRGEHFHIAKERIKKEESSILMQLQAAKSIMQFFISNEGIAHETNICIALDALREPSEETSNKDLMAKLAWVESSNITNQAPSLQRMIANKTGLMTAQSSFYTSLSPQIIRSLVCTIDEIRALAITNSALSSYTFDGVIKDLGNITPVKQGKPHISQDRYNIIMEWEDAQLPYFNDAITQCRECFAADMQPLEKLLQELGGGITYEFDPSHGVKVTIQCPPVLGATHLLQSFSQPESVSEENFNELENTLDEELMLSEPFIHLYTMGQVGIKPSIPFIKFSFPHQDGSGRSFDLRIDQQTFFDSTTLAIAHNFLNFAEGLNSNHSISEIFIEQHDVAGETRTFARVTFNSKKVAGEYDKDSEAMATFCYNSKGDLISSSMDKADNKSW